MFENLSDKLQRAFKTLRGEATLNEENMQEALRAIRLALLEADVNFKVVKQLIDHIQEKAIGQQVATALSPAEQVIKILRDELIEILGRDTAKLKFASQPPTVVLMAGLQGSGKTTTSGKLANWLKNGGHRPLLVSVDVYRPAAREQLKIVAQAAKANIYEGEVGEDNTATVERLARHTKFLCQPLDVFAAFESFDRRPAEACRVPPPSPVDHFVENLPFSTKCNDRNLSQLGLRYSVQAAIL